MDVNYNETNKTLSVALTADQAFIVEHQLHDVSEQLRTVISEYVKQLQNVVFNEIINDARSKGKSVDFATDSTALDYLRNSIDYKNAAARVAEARAKLEAEQAATQAATQAANK